MSEFQAAKELFKDVINPSFYFDGISAESARKKLLEAIGNNAYPLIFIIGDPGVGKSHLIYSTYQSTMVRALSILIERPYFDPNELIRRLYVLRELPYDEIKPQSHVLEELLEAYVGMRCTIFIDEAHLLNETQWELIYLLGDLNVFQFVLTSHKEEGMQLLQNQAIKRKAKLVIEYGHLNAAETLRYIHTLLMTKSYGDIALMFSKKHAKSIARYTKGNFRMTKRFLYTLMKLLDYAYQNKLSKYTTLSNCLLTMTALDIGLIRDA